MVKKLKLSGISGLELQLAYDRLLELQKTFTYEEVDTDTSMDTTSNPEPKTFEQQIEATLFLMKSRLESFPSANLDTLEKLQIINQGTLSLKTEYKERVASSAKLGKEALWSAERFHRHLVLLESHIAKSDERCARAWIDAFLLRVEAMMPNGKYMVLNMEHRIAHTRVLPNSLSTIAGFIDYTVIVESDYRRARSYLANPDLKRFKETPSGFVIIEAKYENPSAYIAQAVCEIYAYAKRLEVNAVRGALTNGFVWIFLQITVNENGEGGQYHQSDPFRLTSEIVPNGEVHVNKCTADLIAAILCYWIEHGFSEVNNDDLLEPL